MPFADKLKQRRLLLNYSQEKLAEEIGVSTRTITNYECGNTFPPGEKLKMIANCLGVTIENLISEDEEYIIEANEKGGSKSAREVRRLAHEVSGLFAGGQLTDEDRDTAMEIINRAYWIAKKNNKKYTPNKYRKDTLE